MTAIHIGTSGWSYDHWEGVLYPHGTPARDRLRVYTQHFDSVELNASFYRWPRETSFASWRQRLPEGFQLSVKAPRGLTHAKRLYAPEVWAERMTSCWHVLDGKRGVLLIQLAPGHARDDARLAYFLGLLPPWMRVAVEFRHQSWHDEVVFALLERHQVAYCLMSGAGLPCVLRGTASFVYVCIAPTVHVSSLVTAAVVVRRERGSSTTFGRQDRTARDISVAHCRCGWLPSRGARGLYSSLQ